MTKKIIVGYRTRIIEPAEVFQALMPKIEANKSIGKDNEAKRAEDIKQRTAAFMEEAKNMPYIGTFDEVTLIAPALEKAITWNYKGREPGAEKQSISAAIGGWLAKHFPDAWPNDTHEVRKPEAVFIGFNPRLFVKMLGIECSLPTNAIPLPVKLWYSNADYRDIKGAILPDECKQLSLQSVLAHRRRPLDPTAAKKWDATMKTWTEPGIDTKADAWLVTELASQLGFLED